MKFFHLITFLFILIFVACKDAPERPEPILDQSAQPATTTTNPVPPATTTTAGSVPHYICPDACVGGGGPSAGNCPICGKTMVHNQAFHSQNQTQNTVPPTGNVNNATPTTPPTQAEPAQNANGVWHYTCANGCPGGAGSAVACATCGTILVHNTQYHQ